MGPTPKGFYLIGVEINHPTKNLPWFNLYQLKPDKTGIYEYNQSPEDFKK
jgi:hypothetical protein